LLNAKHGKLGLVLDCPIPKIIAASIQWLENWIRCRVHLPEGISRLELYLCIPTFPGASNILIILVSHHGITEYNFAIKVAVTKVGTTMREVKEKALGFIQ
jgi:hypothetical protein